MRITTFVVAAAMAATLSQAQQAAPATAELKNAKGEVVGKVRANLMRNGKGVRVVGEVMNVAAGEHGIHIHTVGKCDAPDFTTAGGHFNPGGHKHGVSGQGGHEGDLGNLTVGADGKAKIDMRVLGITMDSGASSLFKEGGTALVIHDKADDLKTDPAGNAGPRIACGVFVK